MLFIASLTAVAAWFEHGREDELMVEPKRRATIFAHWDPEAAVWWAESEDLPGVVAEAASLDAMMAELRVLIPELIQMNSIPHADSIEVTVNADRTEAIELAA